jgi:diketogulonate reductase-like aldo/keto reductase
LWWSDLKAKDTLKACDRVLKELQTDYLDLYLIHWPNHEVPIGETLEAMQKLKEDRKIRHIGVSNFTIHHLQDALNWMTHHSVHHKPVKIVTNQVEFHPSLNQDSLKKFCDDHEIVITAYSPIAQGYDLKLPVVKELAEKYGRSTSQIVLNWLLQKGIVAIPRSSSRDHIEDNFKALEWDLSKEDVKRLDSLDEGHRIVNPGHGEFDY